MTSPITGRRDACGREARFATKQEQDIALDADLTAAFAAEIEQYREMAQCAGAVAAAVGIDSERWKFTRVLLSENEPSGRDEGAAYQVLYLAQPLLAELPQAATRQHEPA